MDDGQIDQGAGERGQDYAGSREAGLELSVRNHVGGGRCGAGAADQAAQDAHAEKCELAEVTFAERGDRLNHDEQRGEIQDMHDRNGRLEMNFRRSIAGACSRATHQNQCADGHNHQWCGGGSDRGG